MNVRMLFLHLVVLFPYIKRDVYTDLSGNGDLIVGFKAQRTLALVGVVKSDGHCGLGNSSLSILVHQVLQVGGSHLSSQRDAQS